MMFVDASAMVAMLTDESEGNRVARILEDPSSPITSRSPSMKRRSLDEQVEPLGRGSASRGR